MASYIEGINQASTAAAQATTASASSSKNVALGKEEFLTLLVAQLQNQDPLNPSDPTEFTAQLAQFGQLEQLINLNSSMEGLTAAQTDTQKLAALSLIGKEIVVEGSTVQLKEEGEHASIGYTLDNSAADLTMQIKNSSGRTIRTLHPTKLDAGTHYLTWDGLDDEGNPVASGKYSLVLQAKSAAEGESVAVTPLVRTLVSGVDLASSPIKLETNIGQFALTNIRGVYDIKDAAASAEGGAVAAAQAAVTEAAV